MSEDTRKDKTRINKMKQPFLRATRKALGGKTAGKGAEQIRTEGASLPFQGPHGDSPLPCCGNKHGRS